MALSSDSNNPPPPTLSLMEPQVGGGGPDQPSIIQMVLIRSADGERT